MTCGFTHAQNTTKPLPKSSEQIATHSLLDNAHTALTKGQYKKASSYINSANDIAKDSTNKAEIQIANATLLYLTGKELSASSILEKIEGKIKSNSKNYIRLLLLRTEIQIKNNEFIAAETGINKIEQSLTDFNSREFQIQLQFVKAQLLQATNKVGDAQIIYSTLVQDAHDKNMPLVEAAAYYNIGIENKKNGLNTEAELQLKTSLKIASDYNFNDIALNSVSQLKELAIANKNFEQAVSYSDIYYELILKDKTKNTSNGITPEESLKLINEQKAEIKRLESSLSGRETSSLLLFVLLTLLGLLTMSLFKNNKLRAKKNDSLEQSNLNLTEERDRAQDAAKIKADFLSTITHELRTPMYAVTGLTHLLLESDPKSNQVEHLQTLQSSGEYLLSLIDNILDFNKLEANKVTLEAIPFDLQKRIKDLTVSLVGQAKDRRNELHLEYDSSIPTRILGDPIKISQILINLIGNSIKFTENGDIWVRVNRIKSIDNKQLIHFEVEDNGRGISQEKQDVIFENFEQEETSTSREYGGTGLGLAIVKNLVELMGGTVSLDSKIGRGSVFSFEVWVENTDSNKFVENHMSKLDRPAVIDTTKLTPKKIETETLTKIAALEKPKLNIDEDAIIHKIKKQITENNTGHPHILIVEDNKINQMITRKILEGKDFRCDVANDGLEAIQAAQASEYDLILMDIHMPQMDGKTATQKIRVFNRTIPIIALTAVTMHENENEFYDLGFDDIIPKPFKMDIFFDKINKALANPTYSNS